MSSSPASAESRRLRSLDGLRGAASLVVVAFHAALISPTFANYQMGGAAAPTSGFWWWMTQTPLRIFIVGNEAVSVFFVLSGLVLALQVARPGKPFDWATYYPRRMVRLYLPMAASLVLASLIPVFFDFQTTTSPSIWIQSGTFTDFSWGILLQNLELFAGLTNLNAPTWSLKWEVIFSLLLPIYVLALRGGRTVAAMCIVLGSVLVGVAMLNGVVTLANLPIFLIGVGLATFYLQRRTAGGNQPSRPARTHFLWAGTLVLSLWFLVGHWVLAPLTAGHSQIQTGLWALTVLGAAGIVATATFWKPAIVLLSTRIFGWLGRVSFSLYLVHVPTLVVTANLLPQAPWYWVALLGVSASFVVAELFTRFVEVPSHRLSKRIQVSGNYSVDLEATSTGEPELRGRRGKAREEIDSIA